VTTPSMLNAVWVGNLKDQYRASPLTARLVACIPVVKEKNGCYTASRSADERRYQIFHEVSYDEFRVLGVGFRISPFSSSKPYVCYTLRLCD
jgi:hypothetical protein